MAAWAAVAPTPGPTPHVFGHGPPLSGLLCRTTTKRQQSVIFGRHRVSAVFVATSSQGDLGGQVWRRNRACEGRLLLSYACASTLSIGNTRKSRQRRSTDESGSTLQVRGERSNHPPVTLARIRKEFRDRRPQGTANGRDAEQPTPMFRGRLRPALVCSGARNYRTTSGTSPTSPKMTLNEEAPVEGRTNHSPVVGRYTAASVRPSPS